MNEKSRVMWWVGVFGLMIVLVLAWGLNGYDWMCAVVCVVFGGVGGYVETMGDTVRKKGPCAENFSGDKKVKIIEVPPLTATELYTRWDAMHEWVKNYTSWNADKTDPTGELKIESFPNGMTVRELKERISELPERDGEEFEVWMMTGRGVSSVVTSVSPLNLGDVLLGSDQWPA